ncbi:tetratricopeptide repeat protein [Neolewinella lacunae]|uniref:Tetratricopeptide repeat protein n=1 Tax=Neolewinella lacunae TaxID=1517758 RepID=A0A923PLM9_9BACT|nr:tetratricopeptide repeat protein [Neolewinella lacunae]MBC6996443.1 tetratricopeptide repeat protein [Neolewinella lacunae]MDN3633614.1 tetratricopeptide repeat protein [Neolewinella lacunae]
MRLLFLFALLAALLPLAAQNQQLAQQYFLDGEYEKSADLYLQLFKERPENSFYFDRYVTSLLQLQRFDEAEAALKRQLRQQPEEVALYVKYGQLLEEKFDEEGAKKQYAKAIEELPADQFRITQLANAFIGMTKYDFAIAAYEKGSTLLKNKGLFSYNLGDLYRRKGENEPMISNYLDALAAEPKRQQQVETYFQRYLDKEGLLEAQKQLYTRIQEGNPNDTSYPEMLAWVFIQLKDYKSALRQARALDKRLDESGERVFRIGQMAANARDYETAISSFDYITDTKGTASPLYLEAKREGLLTRRRAITDGYDYTEQDLRILETAYTDFLDEFGINPASAGIAIQLAELEALFLNDLDRAISILTTVVETPGIQDKTQATAKLSLADFYLMQGEEWESTLLYSQVDKKFKEDLLGHEARFRNARLSYFRGDFEWAQSQFDVLKASTSRLIANDALDLSVFILDNLGLDTSARALQTYADAELLVFQNRFDEAFNTLDGLKRDFPGHDLEDDIIYLKANIYQKLRRYQDAATAYQSLIDGFPESIRLDNSLFALAGLYEKQLGDLAKAQELYETLFIDYSGSILAVEARKKYRELRGDAVQ